MKNTGSKKRIALALTFVLLLMFLCLALLSHSFTSSISKAVTAFDTLTLEKNGRAVSVLDQPYSLTLPGAAEGVLSNSPTVRSVVYSLGEKQTYLVQRIKEQKADFENILTGPVINGSVAEFGRIKDGVYLRWQDTHYTVELYGNIGLSEAAELAQSIYR